MSEQSGGDFVVELPQQVSIRQISNIHATIMSSLETAHCAVFSLPENAEVDLTFVQLLISARKYAAQSGKEIRLAAPASGPLLGVLEDGGFLDDPAQDDAAFWLHKEAGQ